MANELDDLFRRQIAERMASSTTEQILPMSKTKILLQSPDRYFAGQAMLDPANPKLLDYDAAATTGDNPNLKQLGMPPQDVAFGNLQKFQANPSIGTHEDIHQLLKNLGDRFASRRPNLFQSLTNTIQRSDNPEAKDPREFPAYLFANPQELYNDPATARTAQKGYLRELYRFAPNEAKTLSGLVLREGDK